MSLQEETDISGSARGVLLKLWQAKKERGSASIEGFYPVPLEEILQLLGWKLDVVADLGFTDLQPVHGECDHDKGEIRIASDVAANRGQRNFTLAHEIGHAVLHPRKSCDGLPDERVLSRRSGQQVRRMSNSAPRRNVREDEADAFARELLMPRKAVKENFKRIFGHESMPLWASKVKEIVGREKTEAGGPARLRAATRALAKYSSGDGKPLNEVLGVSVEAMARRFEELSLLY